MFGNHPAKAGDNRLAIIYGTRTVLWDGRTSKQYNDRLTELEAEASERSGAWMGLQHPASGRTDRDSRRRSEEGDGVKLRASHATKILLSKIFRIGQRR